MTPEEKILTALINHAEDMVLTPPVPLVIENNEEPTAEVYIRVNHLPNDGERFANKAAGTNRFLGIFQMTIVVPLGKGPLLPARIVGAIADHFYAGLAIFEEGVRVNITDRPAAAPGFRTDDVTWDTPVSIRYDALA